MKIHNYSLRKCIIKSINFCINWIEMKPLVTNQWVMTWLCVCQAHETTSVKKKTIYVVFTLMVFISSVCGLAANLTFFMKFISVELEGSLMAFIGFVAFFGNAYVMTVSFLFRHKINAIFVELYAIYKASKGKNIYT